MAESCVGCLALAAGRPPPVFSAKVSELFPLLPPAEAMDAGSGSGKSRGMRLSDSRPGRASPTAALFCCTSLRLLGSSGHSPSCPRNAPASKALTVLVSDSSWFRAASSFSPPKLATCDRAFLYQSETCSLRSVKPSGASSLWTTAYTSKKPNARVPVTMNGSKKTGKKPSSPPLPIRAASILLLNATTTHATVPWALQNTLARNM
mmetsp:Transcript_35565/g.83092  ORF Transcript_35565/g.83092 Transcript_35565/m.83092 type:complete len:206 (-) Transcript_35565:8-625(-)